MTEAATTAPPPYTIDTPSAETLIHPGSPVNVFSNTDVSGVRASILDNAPVLFVLGHNGRKTIPPSFNIVTVKAPPNARNVIPGHIHACLMFCETSSKGRSEARLFVQSPQRETMEQALLALLNKMQEMLGRRWQLPLSCARPTAPYVYLES